MLKQASGFDRNDEDEDRHRLVVATEAQPIPTASGPRRRSAPTSMAGILKVRAAALQAISLIHSVSSSLNLSYILGLGVGELAGLGFEPKRGPV